MAGNGCPTPPECVHANIDAPARLAIEANAKAIDALVRRLDALNVRLFQALDLLERIVPERIQPVVEHRTSFSAPADAARAAMQTGCAEPALVAATLVMLWGDRPAGLDLAGAADARDVFRRVADAKGWDDQAWLIALMHLIQGYLPTEPSASSAPWQQRDAGDERPLRGGYRAAGRKIEAALHRQANRR